MKTTRPRSGSDPDRLFRPFFSVDAELRIRHWPEITASSVGIPKERALGRFCWQVVHGGLSARPPSCRALCPASESAPRRLPAASSAARCAAIPLLDASRGSIVWFPFTRATLTSEIDSQIEEILIRGALSARLHDLRDTIDGIRRISAADDCELFVLGPSGKELCFAGCEGPDRDAFMERTRIPLGAGYPGMVTSRQQPLFTNDFQNERLFLRDSVRRRGIRSFVGVPLSDDGRPLGYLGLGWRDPCVPLLWVVRMLDKVRPLLSLALPRGAAPRSPGSLTEPLAVRCLGPLEVYRRGTRVAPTAFTRHKARQLLAILIVASGRPVSRDRLVELLWPDADARSGANRLHGVVHALRGVLEEPGSGATRCVHHRGDSYVFEPDGSHYVDLLRFRSLLQLARDARRLARPVETVAGYLEEAISLHRGELFADGDDDEWLDAHRHRVREEYLDAVRELARLRIASGEAGDVLGRLRAALDFEPSREDLHQLLIRALVQSSRRGEAIEQYERCLEALRALELEPLPETVALKKLLYRSPG